MRERDLFAPADRPSASEARPIDQVEQPAVARPVGVMLIAGLCCFAAILTAINAFFNIIEPYGTSGLAASGPLNIVISLALAVVFAATGVGLLRLREWGRTLAVGVLALSIVASVLDGFLVYDLQSALILAVVRSLLPIALLLYLLHPSIRLAFRRRATV